VARPRRADTLQAWWPLCTCCSTSHHANVYKAATISANIAVSLLGYVLPYVCRLSLDERMALVRSFAQEIVQEQELQNLFARKPEPIAYDGFEPSGRMHIAQGVMKGLNVNKLTKCGVRFKFWCAALLNLTWRAIQSHCMAKWQCQLRMAAAALQTCSCTPRCIILQQSTKCRKDCLSDCTPRSRLDMHATCMCHLQGSRLVCTTEPEDGRRPEEDQSCW
jgi:hypothetical protein